MKSKLDICNICLFDHLMEPNESKSKHLFLLNSQLKKIMDASKNIGEICLCLLLRKTIQFSSNKFETFITDAWNKIIEYPNIAYCIEIHGFKK